MKVIANDSLTNYTLLPTNPKEEETLALIISSLKSKDKLEYSGRTKDKSNGTKFNILTFVHKNIEFSLRGHTKKDKYEVNNIRNCCYFGSGGLIYLNDIEIKNKKAIVITLGYCKHCGRAMISFIECEWKICDDCAEKCKHNYESGPVHGGPARDLGTGEFCTICGRISPEQKKGATFLEPE